MFINVYKRLKFVTYGSFSLTYIHLGRGYWEIPNIKNGIYANYFINNPSLLFPPPKLIKKMADCLKRQSPKAFRRRRGSGRQQKSAMLSLDLKRRSVQ